MLTLEQRDLIIKGLSKGLTDPLIAESIPGVTKTQVFNFRQSMKITADQVRVNRYNTWIRMIESGISLEVIGPLYNVKPLSIKIALWKNKDYSFKEVRATVEKAKQRRFAVEVKQRKKNIDW